jgi:hypothetical protein
MVGLAVIIYFVIVGIYAAYELHSAPHLDDNGNEIKKETKTDNLLDFDEDEEFLG